MRRINDNEVALTNEELETYREFIWSTLYLQWDRYTDYYICTDSTDKGMERMNPEMYKIMEQIPLV